MLWRAELKVVMFTVMEERSLTWKSIILTRAASRRKQLEVASHAQARLPRSDHPQRSSQPQSRQVAPTIHPPASWNWRKSWESGVSCLLSVLLLQLSCFVLSKPCATKPLGIICYLTAVNAELIKLEKWLPILEHVCCTPNIFELLGQRPWAQAATRLARFSLALQPLQHMLPRSWTKQ